MKPHRRWLFTIRCNTKDELIAKQIEELVMTKLRGYDPTISMEMTACMAMTTDDEIMEDVNARPSAN